MRKQLQAWIVSTTREAAWAPLLVFGLHVLASRVFHAYALVPALDIPMHFLGGVAIAFFYHRASINASAAGLQAPLQASTHRLLVFSLTGTTTVFWEFAEFISDRYFGTHAQLGLQDTLGDMLLGIAGGLFFLTTLVLLASSRSGAQRS